MKKLLLIVMLYLLLLGCEDKRASVKATRHKSLIRDSLDKKSNNDYKCDFCELIVIDNLNYYEAIHRAEIQYPLSDTNEVSGVRRKLLIKNLYDSLAKTTATNLNWPDSVFLWALKSSVKLDTPCLAIFHYKTRYEEGKALLFRN